MTRTRISETTDIFYVTVPEDCEDDPYARAQLAILQAQEDAPDWIIPAEWSAVADDGYTVTVYRTRPAFVQ